MATLTEAVHSAEFLLSVDNYNRCVEEVTILSGQDLAAGYVVGIVTASGKYAYYDNALSDGRETAAGILLGAVDATAGDTKGVVLVADAEVKDALLTWYDSANDKAAGLVELAALGIKVRV